MTGITLAAVGTRVANRVFSVENFTDPMLEDMPRWWLAFALVRNAVLIFLVAEAHIVAHELSHALVARLVGFRVTKLRVGPVNLVGGLRVAEGAWDPRILLSGATQSLPKGGDHVSGRMALVVAGGPVGTALATLAGGGVFWLVLHLGAPIWVQRWIGYFAFVGLLIFIANLLPLRRTSIGLPNDGWSLIAYLRGAPAWTARLRLALRAAEMESGARPSTWIDPHDWRATRVPAEEDGGWSLLEAMLAAADAGDTGSVEEILAEGRSVESHMSHNVVFDWRLQEAAWQALRNGQAEPARRALPTFAVAGLAGYEHLAEAAVELAFGNESAAQLLSARWVRFLRRQPVAAQTLAGNQWIVETLAERLGDGEGREALVRLMEEPYFRRRRAEAEVATRLA